MQATVHVNCIVHVKLACNSIQVEVEVLLAIVIDNTHFV